MSPSRVMDLLDPAMNRIHNMDVEEAPRRVLNGDPATVRGLAASGEKSPVIAAACAVPRRLAAPREAAL